MPATELRLPTTLRKGKGLNVAETICRWALTDPERPALIEAPSGRVLTFAELDRRSTALAIAFVDDLGARPGDRIAILAKNCNEYLELYLACAKAGCVAHGLNWRFATPTMAAALRDSAPVLVCVHDDFATVAGELRRRLEVPHWRSFGPGSDGSYEAMVEAHRGRHLEIRGGGDDPLMIMYTGGTTGDSKGALHSHATVGAAMANNTIAERIVPTDRYMLLGQAFHSSAVLALNYLRHGCAVVVINFDPVVALEAIDEWGVSGFLGYPTMLTYMLEQGTGGRFSLASLRNIQYGGGMFAATTVLALLETFPCTLIQCYGTTESIGITFLSQEDHERARQGRPDLLRSCGRPAFLTDVRLAPSAEAEADEVDGRPVGEVQVRSASSMLGYWSDFTGGGRPRREDWLATGDLGYFDDAGYLYLVGRSKDVIISGGENIYANQVENAIAAHPSVLETAVIGVPDEVWGEAVKAVVVLRPGAEPVGAEEIRELVRSGFASYAKPKHVEFVDELPRTPTGKVLKRALVPDGL
jgi:acyl-CoA synthetase (AMP-forming)/AMP-acid ligase II